MKRYIGRSSSKGGGCGGGGGGGGCCYDVLWLSGSYEKERITLGPS